MYIITKLVSVANPATNLLHIKKISLLEKTVAKFPTAPKIFEATRQCNLPILSAKTPKIKLPNTDPIKNTDCPRAGIQSKAQTQSNS